MNLGKLTNIVLGAIKSRKDKTNKITQLAMAINGTYVEEEPVVTAPIFDSVDLIGETFSSSQFQLGDNIIYNATVDNELISPYVIFLTAEQYSKFLITGAFVDNEARQAFENEVLSSIFVPVSDLVSDLGEVSFTIPQNAAYACLLCFAVAEAIIVAEATGTALATSITVTYDGVNYVYDNTNVQITTPEKEPEAPTLYSAVFTGGAVNTVTTSEYTLGDNLVVSKENSGTSLSPALLLLTSELAQNMSVSVTTTGNSSSLISPEMLLNFVDSMSVKELTNFTDVDLSSISSFISEHNITHVVSFMNVYDAFAPSLQGTSDEIISSFTITYNGNPYVYGFDSFTFNIGQ